MEDISNGFKLLRNALILALIASIIPIASLGAAGISITGSFTIQQLATSLYASVAASVLSGLLSLVSLFLLYRGWMEMCYGLDETFCTVGKVIKYGTASALALLIISLGMMYSSLQHFMDNPAAAMSAVLAASPLLMLSSLAMLAVFLSIVYAFYKLGEILTIGNLKIGAGLLLIGPLLTFSGVLVLSYGLTLLALIILAVETNKLVGAEIELEEPEGEDFMESVMEEPRRTPERRGMAYHRRYRDRSMPPEPEPMRDNARDWEVEPATQRISREVGAQLIGPNGFTVKLRPGIRTFGRRDFAGFVPDEELDYISRRHFEIRGTPQGFFIRDLGSLNGTWVNGRKLDRGESVKLNNGAVIDVAEVVRLRFVSSESDDLGVPSL